MSKPPSRDYQASVAAAVDAVREADADAFLVDRAEQLSLFPDAKPAVERALVRSGPGRPPGSRNKRTIELAAAISAQFGNPVLRLAEQFAFAPVEVIAARLRCDLVEAAKLQIAALTKVAEYTDQKQPQAVQVSGIPAGPAPVVHLSLDAAQHIGLDVGEVLDHQPEPVLDEAES